MTPAGSATGIRRWVMTSPRSGPLLRPLPAEPFDDLA